MSSAAQPQMRQPQNPFADDVAKRQSGVAALGMGLMAMDDDSDDDEPTPTPARVPTPRSPPPIAAPKPGYVSQPIDLARPEPIATPVGREPVALPSALQRTPSTEPHPLRAPMTPIQPVFARPKKAEPAVQFTTPIMRGGSEDVLIPKRGEKGDDFWRRFSMVAHSNEKESQWLSKTQGGSAKMSRRVWALGLLLLLLIVAGIGFGVYYNHLHQTNIKSAPHSVGGHAGDHSGSPATDADSHASASGAKHSSSLFVAATNTVARREALAHPTNVARTHAGLRSRQNRILDLD